MKRSFRRRRPMLRWVEAQATPFTLVAPYNIPFSTSPLYTAVMLNNIQTIPGGTSNWPIQRFGSSFRIRRIVGKSIYYANYVGAAASTAAYVHVFRGFFVSKVDESGNPLDQNNFQPFTQQTDNRWLHTEIISMSIPGGLVAGNGWTSSSCGLDISGITTGRGGGGVAGLPNLGAYDIKTRRRMAPDENLFMVECFGRADRVAGAMDFGPANASYTVQASNYCRLLLSR